jgi:tetratricopeptide (TPR) repeat protein
VELGQTIHIDGSMISRFETGAARPGLPVLQDIINALALHDVPRERLDRMREAAGYSQLKIDTLVSDPIVPFINQEYEKLSPAQRSLLSRDLRSVIEIDQGYFSVQKAGEAQKWEAASAALLVLRDRLEQRVQRWYLRIDEELGRCLYGEGRYTEAIQHYESALWSARQTKELDRQGEILIQLGNAHRRCGGVHWEAAHRCYEEAKAIFESQGNHVQVAECLRRAAAVYLFQGRPDRAEPLCDESIRICRDMADDRGLYKSSQHKAWACCLLGRWEEAIQLLEQALAMVEAVTVDEWEQARALRYLADAYRLQGQLAKAESMYRKALGIVQRSDRAGHAARLLRGSIQLGLGKVYLKLPRREQEARLCLNESMEVHRIFGEDFRVAEIWSQQASLLLRVGRLEEAKVRLLQASDHLRRLGETQYYVEALATLCELYYLKKDLGQLQRVAASAREADDGLVDHPLARIEILVAKAHVDRQELSDASRALCAASVKALNFNRMVFGEICSDIMGQVDRVAREISPGEALRLLGSLAQFWDSKEIPISRQRLAREWMETIQRKREEIETLLAIERIQW